MKHNIPRELSDVQFVLLGLIIEKEKSGSQLRLELRDQFSWDTKTSSFYTYYERLAAQGYCAVKGSKVGKKFRVTAKGKRVFQKKLNFLNDSVTNWKKHL